LTAEEIETTKRRFHDAALRAFERQGYAAATMRLSTETHLLWLNCRGLISLHLANQVDLGHILKSLVRPLVDHRTGSLAGAAHAPTGQRRKPEIPADEAARRRFFAEDVAI
jgi:hypothetical protein